MSVYVPPALNAVDFALSAHTPVDTTSPSTQGLTVYTPPALSAVDFALSAYTPAAYPMYVGWELLPSGFPTQFAGLRTFYSGAVKELCLVAEADAPAGMGGVIKIDKNGTLYAVYLVETTDPDASPVRVKTSTGVKSVRLKT